MRVFISWSGDASKLCAEALRDWLPFMNQAIDPFVSSQDISKGERGLDKIASQLQRCNYGIVCVTRENQHAPWINFESGALSRELGESLLAPFLLDLAVKDLSGPIAQFQATESSSRDDVWSLVKSINEKSENSVDLDRLRVTFDRFWGDLQENLERIRSVRPHDALPERETSEILNELVALVREQSSRVHSLERKISLIEMANTVPRYTINEPAGEITINATQREDSVGQFKRMRRAILDIIGPENVLKINSSGPTDLEVYTSEEGLRAAHASEEKLRALASSLGVGTYINTPGNRRDAAVILAPF
ncbi:TIR domain-containing protein [Streptomyces sp. AC550_RSS872]|uniref:TIR domain-containing protein n=1 Tax=Streptomyces sp. AC550_RSS872 TaxID=2823689 RepID=UPI001C276FC2|nr:TIR domain-containing protein [Streptomyces sp. AC550_RSS872]